MAGSIQTRARPRSVSISAVITRADGRVENLGTISYFHKNPLLRWAWHGRRWLKEKLKWLH